SLALLALGTAVAAPEHRSTSSVTTADHVTGCNLTVDSNGTLFLDGEALAGAELAAVQALLGSADLAAALEVAADADADACINLDLDIGAGGITATINAHIAVCPANVEVNADGDLVIDGAVFAGDFAGSDLAALADFAAAADIALCAEVVVINNEVAAIVTGEACLFATLNSDDTVTIELAGEDLVLDAGVVLDAEAELEVGVAIEVGLALRATADLQTDSVTISAAITELEGCGEDTGGGQPSASPSAAATLPGATLPGATLPGATSTASPGLPDTQTAGSSATGGLVIAAALMVTWLASVAVALVAYRMRRLTG
ncbi:MAG TPA: hypothetical protein VHK63_04870, partial [Candidatus Limnocylindria bacterium]|nr:hypothetical protein [Candidatus Limnocylindria bacterium]